MGNSNSPDILLNVMPYLHKHNYFQNQNCLAVHINLLYATSDMVEKLPLSLVAMSNRV